MRTNNQEKTAKEIQSVRATSCPHFFRLRTVLVIILKPQTLYTSCPMDPSPKIFTCLEISFKLLLKYLVHSSYESPQSTLTTIMNWEVFYHVSSEIWNCLTNQLMLDEKKWLKELGFPKINNILLLLQFLFDGRFPNILFVLAMNFQQG